MERKIGEVFNYHYSVKLQVAESDVKSGCKGCYFEDSFQGRCRRPVEYSMSCTNIDRKDHKNVIFREVK
jgi:hypothetical protein